MTVHETKVLEALTATMAALKEEVHIHMALTKQTFEKFKELCDERHGIHPGRLAKLEAADAEKHGAIERIKGMGVPVAICVSVVAVILNLFT